jgi:hypothetical protein
MEISTITKIWRIRIEGRKNQERKLSFPHSTRKTRVTQIHNGIRSEISFSKNMSKLDILKVRCKELNISDKGFKPPRNRAFVEDAINYELRVSFYLNYREVSV